MRAILDATGYSEALDPLIQHAPSPLFRVFDKAIIVHIIEHLAHNGVTAIHLILSHLPEMIEHELEEGARWGVELTYHLVKDCDRPLLFLKPVKPDWDDTHIVLGRGDVLPFWDLSQQFSRKLAKPVLLFDERDSTWTGWGIVPTQRLDTLDAQSTYDTIVEQLADHKTTSSDAPSISVATFDTLCDANIRSLTELPPNFFAPSTAHQVEAGVWLSRACIIHGKATLKPPVFVGENAQIMAGATVGPNVVLEKNCYIDQGSTVENTLVCRQSYVGSALEVRESVVDHNTLVNLSHKAAVKIRDDFILGRFEFIPFCRHIGSFIERTLALIAFIITLPLQLPLVAFFGLQRREMLCLPAYREPERWQTFQFLSLKPPTNALFHRLWRTTRHLPTLINMIRGEVHFVGLHPRPPNQVRVLPNSWRYLYLTSKVGAITLAYVDHGHTPTEVEKFGSETYYAAHTKVRLDLRIILRWARRKLRSLFGRCN